MSIPVMSGFDDEDWGDFDAFDEDQPNHSTQPPPNQSASPAASPIHDNDNDDDDDWGDFGTQFTNPPVTNSTIDTSNTNTTPSATNNNNNNNDNNVEDTLNAEDIDPPPPLQGNNVHDTVESPQDSTMEAELDQTPQTKDPKQRTPNPQDRGDIQDEVHIDKEEPNPTEIAQEPPIHPTEQNENADGNEEEEEEEDDWGFDDDQNQNEMESKMEEEPSMDTKEENDEWMRDEVTAVNDNPAQNHVEISEDDERTNDEEEDEEESEILNNNNHMIEDKVLNEEEAATHRMEHENTKDADADEWGFDEADHPKSVEIIEKPTENKEDPNSQDAEDEPEAIADQIQSTPNDIQSDDSIQNKNRTEDTLNDIDTTPQDIERTEVEMEHKELKKDTITQSNPVEESQVDEDRTEDMNQIDIPETPNENDINHKASPQDADGIEDSAIQSEPITEIKEETASSQTVSLDECITDVKQKDAPIESDTDNIDSIVASQVDEPISDEMTNDEDEEDPPLESTSPPPIVHDHHAENEEVEMDDSMVENAVATHIDEAISDEMTNDEDEDEDEEKDHHFSPELMLNDTHQENEVDIEKTIQIQNHNETTQSTPKAMEVADPSNESEEAQTIETESKLDPNREDAVPPNQAHDTTSANLNEKDSPSNEAQRIKTDGVVTQEMVISEDDERTNDEEEEEEEKETEILNENDHVIADKNVNDEETEDVDAWGFEDADPPKEVAPIQTETKQDAAAQNEVTSPPVSDSGDADQGEVEEVDEVETNKTEEEKEEPAMEIEDVVTEDSVPTISDITRQEDKAKQTVTKPMETAGDEWNDFGDEPPKQDEPPKSHQEEKQPDEAIAKEEPNINTEEDGTKDTQITTKQIENEDANTVEDDTDTKEDRKTEQTAMEPRVSGANIESDPPQTARDDWNDFGDEPLDQSTPQEEDEPPQSHQDAEIQPDESIAKEEPNIKTEEDGTKDKQIENEDAEDNADQNTAEEDDTDTKEDATTEQTAMEPLVSDINIEAEAAQIAGDDWNDFDDEPHEEAAPPQEEEPSKSNQDAEMQPDESIAKQEPSIKETAIKDTQITTKQIENEDAENDANQNTVEDDTDTKEDANIEQTATEPHASDTNIESEPAQTAEDDWNDFGDDPHEDESITKDKEEEEDIANAELPLEDIDDTEELTLSNIDSDIVISPTKSDENDEKESDKDSDLDLRIKDDTLTPKHVEDTITKNDPNEDEVIYMSEEENEPNKYDDLPEHILKDKEDGTTPKPQDITAEETNIDDEFGDDDWGSFDGNFAVQEEKKEDPDAKEDTPPPTTDTPEAEQTVDKTPTPPAKPPIDTTESTERAEENVEDAPKQDTTETVTTTVAVPDEDWDDDDWGDFGEVPAPSAAAVATEEDKDTKREETPKAIEKKEDAPPLEPPQAAPSEDTHKDKDDTPPEEDDWGDDAWGDDEAFEAAPPPPDAVHEDDATDKEKHQTPPPSDAKDHTTNDPTEMKLKPQPDKPEEDEWGDDTWDDKDLQAAAPSDETQSKPAPKPMQTPSQTPATSPRSAPPVDNSVLNRILTVSEDTNVQFNALCKVLYTFGGVCASTQEKYISDDKAYEYYAGTEDDSKDTVKTALPDLAMPLSIKPSNIDEFVWDGSNIETKLYDAIQLPKPKPKRKGRDGKREPEKEKKKKEPRRPPRKDQAKKPNRSQTATPVTEQKDNAHADVFAMFGDVFKNGTNPGKRSENVEDVLKDMPKVQEKPANTVKAQEPKKDLLAELFGDDGLTSTTSNTSNTNGEMDEKHKEKMRAAATREIRKLISSIPDLSFLKNIKVI